MIVIPSHQKNSSIIVKDTLKIMSMKPQPFSYANKTAFLDKLCTSLIAHGLL